MKNRVITIIFILSNLLIAQSELTLTNAINKGLDNNYNLRISKKSVDISEEYNSWGAAGRYPTIDVSVSSINRLDYNIDAETDVTTNNIAPSAQLNWILFNGFKIFNTKRKLADQYKLSQGNNAVAVENTIQSIILAYYDVLLQKESVTVIGILEKLSKDRYDRALASKEIGGTVTFNVLQAKIAWLEDRSNFLIQKLNYENSVRSLNLLIGEKADKSYSGFDEFNTEMNNYVLDDLKEKMTYGNKTLKNQYLNEIIKEREIDIATGGMYPKIMLSSGYDYLNSKKNPGIPRTNSKSYDYYGNLTLSVNLFDGLNTRRSLEVAKIQHEISKIETEEMKHTLTNNLIQLLDLYNIQKDLIVVAEENLEASKLNLEISEEKFKNGAINSFNYRDIQIIFLNASIKRLQSIFNLIKTNTDLARLTGSIISEN